MDDFDADLNKDARNVHIGLVTDGFMHYNTSAASYSCWLIIAISYNIPSSLCMKYEHVFLCLVIPSPNHFGTRLNVMLKPLIEELKQFWEESKRMTMTGSKNSTFVLRIYGRSMILRPTIFFRMELQ
jgi:hypothetical protein